LNNQLFTRAVALAALGVALWAALTAGAGHAYAQETPPLLAINYEFQAIKQGQIGLISITGVNLSRGVARTFDREFPCYPSRLGLTCVLAAPIDQPIRAYDLTIDIFAQDGSKTTRGGQVTVAGGGFIAESFTLPGNLNYLLRDDVQANEDDRLTTVYSIITPTRYWDGQFTPPIPSPVVVSLFGTVRTYTNTGTVRRHTGIDFRASVGTPVLAAANGRVALSRPMDIHGNNIVIDHGWGIYSEYAHLSERYVVPGQFVLQGDVIGMSGNTGRSTGPHVHWEIAVGGVWVNPVLFAQIRLPQ
jgi:hypothetical protein